MSRTDTWMPLYIGDYLADTGRLTTLGHGAYMLILMDYWRNGPPPDDDAALAAIARVDRKTWDREIRSVIRSFFKLGDDRLLHQKRLDSERAHAIDLSEKRRLAALQKRKQSAADQGPDQNGPTGQSDGGGNGSKDPSKQEQLLSNSSTIAEQLNGDSTPIAELEECNTSHTRASRPYALPSPSPVPKLESKKANTPKPPRGQVTDDDPDFAEFWSVYPRKDDKGHAKKAWDRAIRKAPASAIIAGCAAYKFEEAERYQPLPTTWLNGERWKTANEQAIQNDGMDPVLRAAGVTQADIDRMFGNGDDKPENPMLRFLQ